MSFTSDNTEGYTRAELAGFNAELAERLAGIDPHDLWLIEEVTKSISDEVGRR